MKQKLFIFFLIFSFKAFSDFQGSFDSIENLPGFIDFNEDSRWYKGPIKLKYRKLNDGVDRRTPSKILDSFFDGDAFSVDKANKLIKTVETFRKNAFLSFCMEKLPKKALDNFFCILGLEKKLDKKLAKKFKKIQKKWKDEKYNLGLDEVVRRIESAIKKSSGITRENINTANSQAFLNDFFTGYEIFEILKGEDAPRGMQGGFNGMIIRHGGVFLFDTSIIGDCRRKSGICDRYSKRAEAANLLVPTDLKNQHPDQVFLSKDDLAKLKNNKYPLENLNPPDSGFWRKPKVAVSKFNLTNYNKSGYSSLANELNHGQRLKMMNRHIPIDVVYKPGRFKGGTTPKFYGYLKNTKTGKKGKQKWKVKFVTDKFGLTSNSLFNLILNLANSGETNTEPAVNNLAAALGFGVDPTYYKDRIRVFFPDEIYQDSKGKELSKSQWTELFDNELVRVRKEIRDAFSIDYNTDSSFNQKFVKIDPASGRPYIELKSVALEKKKDEERDINIGAFVRHGIGKSLKREHRAFALFLAWVEDRDTKNENDRAKLLNSAKGSKSPKFKLGHSASDMGSAFGTGSINNLPTDMVETLRYHKFGSDKGEVKRIKLTYRRIGMLEIINAMSNSDAKWILKMMAQFGLEQLKDCFNAAGFPSVVAEAFARKMITRRNQLLEAFKMEGMVYKDFAGNDFKIDLKKKKLSLITNPKEKDLIYADSLDKKYYYEDGFNRPIAGSEHLFRRPKAGIPKFVNPWILKDTALELYDPKKQMFPRYWDADMLGALLGDSEGQEKRVIKDLKKVAGDFIRNLLVNPVEFPLRAGFNLARLAPGVNTEVGQVCKTDCYFSGILKGVSTFFPKRMAFDNPDKE